MNNLKKELINYKQFIILFGTLLVTFSSCSRRNRLLVKKNPLTAANNKNKEKNKKKVGIKDNLLKINRVVNIFQEKEDSTKILQSDQAGTKLIGGVQKSSLKDEKIDEAMKKIT